MRQADLRADIYFKHPCAPLASVRAAIPFTVIDVEACGSAAGGGRGGELSDRFLLAEITVARSSDLGVNDERFICRSHLGHILHAGDEVLGCGLALLRVRVRVRDTRRCTREYHGLCACATSQGRARARGRHAEVHVRDAR